MNKNLLLILISLSCSSCQTLYDRNGSKFKLWGLTQDNSKKYKNSEIKSFDISKVFKEINSRDSNYLVELIKSNNIEELKTTNKKFAVLFWYPRCAASIPIIDIANRLDSIGVPIIMASLHYDVFLIKEMLKGSKFENRVTYIIPAEQYGTKMILKKIYFTRDLCKGCYDKYKDELVHSNGLLINNGKIDVLFDLNYEDISKSLK